MHRDVSVREEVPGGVQIFPGKALYDFLCEFGVSTFFSDPSETFESFQSATFPNLLEYVGDVTFLITEYKNLIKNKRWVCQKLDNN